MTRDINGEYFDWLCSLVSDSIPNRRGSYRRLMIHLYHIDFTYVMPMDGNRFADGVNLRYRFGYEHGIDDPIIASCLDNEPCSVLEMMVALALRCEEHIMSNIDTGLMSGRWFWMMIDNLGLVDMIDTRFDWRYVDNVINRFLNRDYEHDGKGGLIYIPNSQEDMRTIEIWYQLMKYLNMHRRNGD